MLSHENIEIDLLTSHIIDNDYIDYHFTVHRHNHTTTLKILEKMAEEVNASSISSNIKVSKLSLIGAALRTHATIRQKMLRLLSEAEIPVFITSHAEIKTSVVLEEYMLNKAIEILHRGFALEQTTVQNYSIDMA